MAPLRSAPAVTCAVLALSAVAALASVPPAADDAPELAADDECAAGAGAGCAMSALQLQGRRATGASVAPRANATDPRPGAAASALPNGTSEIPDITMGIGAQAAAGTLVQGGIVTGYHQTSPEIGMAILGSHFRPGHVGYCGGGIYFAANPWVTYQKAIGPDSKHGFIIEARIDLGRSKYMGPSCMSPKLGVATLSHTPTSHYLHQMHADSFIFNPVDGMEYVIADPRRVISMHQFR